MHAELLHFKLAKIEFLELGDFKGDDQPAISLFWVAFEVVLVVVFSFIKPLQWFNLCYYLTDPDFFFRQFFYYLFGCCSLFITFMHAYRKL